MNRGLKTVLVALALSASACAQYDIYQQPVHAGGQFRMPQGGAYPASSDDAWNVASNPRPGQQAQSGTRERELVPDGPPITTGPVAAPCVEGTFIQRDPVTNRVFEKVMECTKSERRPREDSAQCINPRNPQQCLLGVRDGNKCTPHPERTPCSNWQPPTS